MKRRVPLLALLVVLATACGELLGVSGSSDEPPATPPAGSDGQAPGDASGFDGSGDDAGILGEADADAGPRFCALGTYAFCDDFDRGLVVGAMGWSEVMFTGQVRIDGTASSSAPDSLHVQRVGVASGDFLRKTLATGAFSRIVIHAKVRCDALAADDTFAWMRIGLGASVIVSLDAVSTDGVGPRFGLDQGGGSNAMLEQPIAVGAFQDVAVDIDVDGGTMTMAVDGTTTAAIVVGGLGPGVSSVELSVGALASASDGGTTNLHVDDVTVLLQ